MLRPIEEPFPTVRKNEDAEGWTFVTYTAPTTDLNAPTVVIYETPSVLASSGNTGLRTWEAALRLGTYLYSDAGRSYVANASILELGMWILEHAILVAAQFRSPKTPFCSHAVER